MIRRERIREFFRGTGVVARRELGALFDSSVAYIYFIAFSVSAAAIFMNDFFLRGVVDMAPWFEPLPLLGAVFVPALTMRLWAEERRTLTHELLMTLPLHPSQIVLGKFTAAYLFYLLSLLGGVPVIVMLVSLGAPDPGLIVSAFLGAGLMGGVLVALGCLMSGLTSHQIVAFIVTSVAAGILVLTGDDTVVATLDGLAHNLELGTLLYESISLLPHFEQLSRGVVALSDVAWFVAMTAAFLWLNLQSVSKEVP